MRIVLDLSRVEGKRRSWVEFHISGHGDVVHVEQEWEAGAWVDVHSGKNDMGECHILDRDYLDELLRGYRQLRDQPAIRQAILDKLWSMERVARLRSYRLEDKRKVAKTGSWLDRLNGDQCRYAAEFLTNLHRRLSGAFAS